MLHSILLTGSDRNDGSTIPPLVSQNIDSFVEWHPGRRHTLYGDASLREFIKDKLGNEVVEAYDDLMPLAYKADLGRYCLLYEFGGLYSDVSNFFFSPFQMSSSKNKLYVLRDRGVLTPWIVSNCLISAPPQMQVFQNCIEQIIQNVRSRYYGVSSLCPTGPILFGRTIAQSVDPYQLLFGEVVTINESRDYDSLAHISPRGELVAIRRKWSEGIASLGIKGPKSYDELYNEKLVYRGERADHKVFDDKYFQQRGILHCRTDKSGTIVFTPSSKVLFDGPFVDVDPGRYEIRLALMPADGVEENIECDVIVLADHGRLEVLPPTRVNILLGRTGFIFKIDFKTLQKLRGMSVRITANRIIIYKIEKMEIVMI